MGRSRGLPLKCPKCPSKHYYGVLKAPAVPTDMVRYGKPDVCPNCRTPLIIAPGDGPPAR